MFPGESGVRPGGLPYRWAAQREGGPRNGVLTAVEDFVAARDGLRLAVVPAFFGLGVVWHARRAVGGRGGRRSLERWDGNPLLERLEANRVLHLASSHVQMVKAARAQERLARQEAVLRRLLDSSAFSVAERLSRLRRGAGIATAPPCSPRTTSAARCATSTVASRPACAGAPARGSRSRRCWPSRPRSCWHETRGTTLWFDEWQWALDRRGSDVGTFLRPHNEHLSLVPIAVYKAAVRHGGPDGLAPVPGARGSPRHLACVVLLFVYASGAWAARPRCWRPRCILFLGPAWQNILWPFQVGWLISLAAGLGALLLLDRARPARRGGGLRAARALARELGPRGPDRRRGGRRRALGPAAAAAAWIVAVPLAALRASGGSSTRSRGFVRHNMVRRAGLRGGRRGGDA